MCSELVANGRHCQKDVSAVPVLFILILQDGKKQAFVALCCQGLAEYNEMEGVAWRLQSIDGSMTKALLAKGKNRWMQSDRGKKRSSAIYFGGGMWGTPPDLCRWIKFLIVLFLAS